MVASGFYHDDLRMMPGFHMLGLGDSLRGNSFWMLQNLVADFVFVETINESFRYFHTQPPMQIITFQGDLYSPDPAQDLIEANGREIAQSETPFDDRTRAAKTAAPETLLSMATCEVCKNEYDKTFEVIVAGKRHTFDSFECAIHALVPICPHCHCRVVGHGGEQGGKIFCCVHCARSAGQTQLKARI
jgi:hypothetical protein